jgi:hypothetical protein
MKKSHIIMAALVITLIGFNVYTQSGTPLDEELLIEEPALSREDQETVHNMMDRADTMSDEEKQLAEESMVEIFQKMAMDNPIPLIPETPAPPSAEKKGTFTETDIIHKGSGEALIYPNAKGGPTLRLQNFSVTRGPDLYVYLSKNTNIKDNGMGEFTNLGKLKSSKGNQNYSLPEDWKNYNSVVIWCKAFGVLFSEAELK